MPFDYEFVQQMSNFGREMAGNFVGQPFSVYRLNATSSQVVHADNLVDADLRAKVGALRARTQIENGTMHAETFEFLVSSDRVQTEDVLVQNDPVYGGDSAYAIVSRRPLKKVLGVRVESTCRLYRMQSNRTSGYSGPTNDSNLPWVLRDGKFELGVQTDTPTDVLCGITYVGQIKDWKVTKLPVDTQTGWYYVFVPLFPGLAALRENDIIEHVLEPGLTPVKYRVHAPYVSPAGARGVYLLCERATI